MKCEAYTAMGNSCERDARQWYLLTLEDAAAAFYVCTEHAQLHQLHFIMRLHEAGAHITDKELAHRRELADKILRGEDPPADGSAVLNTLEASMKEVVTPKPVAEPAGPAVAARPQEIGTKSLEVPVTHSTGWFAVLCGCGHVF
jgi:hypothetical protein